MGKSKKKTVDFKKIKLKVGKKLNKPNDTKTDFKASKLVLLTQLKSAHPAGSELCKHDLHEISQHTRHHNVNVRKDALGRLTDLIAKQNRAELKKVLGEIVEISIPLCSDVEQSIRDLVYNVFKSLLNKVESIDFSPVSLQLIMAHISCSATHLNANVRLFACRLLALLVQQAPSLCSGRLEFVQCYADMVSGSKSSGKLISRAHKSQILSGLCSLFELLFSPEKCSTQSALLSIETAKPINPVCCSLVRNPDADPFMFSLTESDNFGSITNSTQVIGIFEQCLTFCDDFWLELIPSQQDEQKLFDESTLLDMDHVIRIIMLMYDTAVTSSIDNDQNEVLNRLLDAMRQERRLVHFLKVFPCALKRQQTGNAGAAKLCQKINLAICQMVFWVRNRQSLFEAPIRQYLEKLRQKGDRLPKEIRDIVNQLVSPDL